MPFLIVAGNMMNASFQLAKNFAEDCKVADPTLSVEIVSLVEADWRNFLSKIQQDFRGDLFSHPLDQPAVLHSVIGYIGGSDEFLDWGVRYYSLPDIRLNPQFDQIWDALQDDANSEFSQYIKKSPHKFALMDFALSKTDLSPHRVIFELFEKKCPKTVANFLALCSGSNNSKLHYVNSPVHRIVKDGWIQAGDIISGNGDSGESIYGRFFADESFIVKHDSVGVLSMANEGPHTNNSQFFITLRPLPSFDGQFVAFGRVIVGFSALETLNQVSCKHQRPNNFVHIAHSDEFKSELQSSFFTNWMKQKKPAPKKTTASSSTEEKKAPTKKATLVICGLDGHGKSTLVNHWLGKGDEDTNATLGFELRKTVVDEYAVTFFGLGGSSKIRGYWSNYYDEVHGVVYVVNPFDLLGSSERMEESKTAFIEMIKHPLVQGKPILFVLNKQEQRSSLNVADFLKKFDMDNLKKQTSSSILIAQGRAKQMEKDDGLYSGLHSMLQSITQQYELLQTRISKDVQERKQREKEKLEALKKRIEEEKQQQAS